MKTLFLKVLQQHLEMDLDVDIVLNSKKNLYMYMCRHCENEILYSKRSYTSNLNSEHLFDLSQCMRFPTIRYVRPAKPQISLRIHAV